MKILFITNDLNFKLGADTISHFPKSDTIAVISILKSGPQKAILEKLGVKLFELDFLLKFETGILRLFKKFKSIFFVLFFRTIVKNMQKNFEDFQPDIIHTNLWLSDITGILAAKKYGAKKIISTQHDEVKINFFALIMKRRLLRSVDCVIAISESVAEFTQVYFKVPKEKIKIVYNGIDFEYFLGCQKPNTEWEPVIGQVGRLEKIKGQIFLLEALKIINDTQKKSLSTIFIGSGSQEKFLKDYATRNNLQADFIPLTADIRPWLKKIDILVIPSLSEGFGVVVIEGLAAKKLVLASNVGGITEIIENNKNGILVDPASPEQIAQKIIWAIENKDKAFDLREKGSGWIITNRKNFDIQTTADEYRKIYLQ